MLDVSVTIINLSAIFSTLNISADFNIFSVSCKRIPQDTTDITISLGTFGVVFLMEKDSYEIKNSQLMLIKNLLTPFVQLFDLFDNYL